MQSRVVKSGCLKALFSLQPILYLLYTALLADAVRYDTTRCNFPSTLTVFSYTVFFNQQRTAINQFNTLAKIDECSTDLDYWISQNRLNFKKDKNELLYFYSKFKPQQCLPRFHFGTNTTQPAQSARNNGVILGSTMTMLLHVDSVCKSAFYLLRNISRIRNFVSTKNTKILVPVFVSSKLDH